MISWFWQIKSCSLPSFRCCAACEHTRPCLPLFVSLCAPPLQHSPTLQCSRCVFTLLVDTLNKAQSASILFLPLLLLAELILFICWYYIESDEIFWFVALVHNSIALFVALVHNSIALFNVCGSYQCSVHCAGGIRSPTEIAEQRKRGPQKKKRGRKKEEVWWDAQYINWVAVSY